MLLRSASTTDFGQASQCLALLRRINPTDTEEAVATLGQLLEGMAINNPEPIAHLSVLEELRPTLDFVLGVVSRRYASRPLPPSSSEEETLKHVVRLWNLMVTNYEFIAQRAANTTEPQLAQALANQRALLLHRRLQYFSLGIVEYFRARREVPTGCWRDLHALFVSAEKVGVASTRVADSLNETWGAQSSLECYVAMLLIDAAGPYSRTSREFLWLVRWAVRFAPYCSLENSFIGDKSSCYALDTDADHGLLPVGLLAPDVRSRSLNTSKLAAHIQGVVSQLKKGVSASSLGLGDDCVQPACARLLVSLYRPWGLAAAGRKFQRRAQQGQVQICADLMGVAFFLTGSQFTSPDPTIHYNDFVRTEAMLTFGEQVENADLTPEQVEERALQLGYAKESWDVLDQSVAGFRLIRQAGESRVEHRQLLGVCPSPGESMLIAEVSWLQYQRTGALTVGVSMMPGPPTAIPVKLLSNDRSGAREQYRLGFLIPGVLALKTDPSLIVPAGWYMADRRIEVHAEKPWTARMVKLVSRGSNFDRINFVREVTSTSREI